MKQLENDLWKFEFTENCFEPIKYHHFKAWASDLGGARWESVPMRELMQI